MEIFWSVLILIEVVILSIENWWMHVIKRGEYNECIHWKAYLADRFNNPKIIPIWTLLFDLVVVLLFNWKEYSLFHYLFIIIGVGLVIINDSYQIIKKTFFSS